MVASACAAVEIDNAKTSNADFVIGSNQGLNFTSSPQRLNEENFTFQDLGGRT